MSEPDGVASIEEVAEELEVVLVNPANLKTLLSDDDHRVLKLRTIVEKLKRDLWDSDRVAALKYVVARAALDLPDSKDVFRLSGSMANVEFVIRIFNIAFTEFGLQEQNLDHVHGRRYTHILKQVREAGNIHASTSVLRTEVSKLRHQLAEQLLARVSAADQPSDVEVKSDDIPYFPRPEEVELTNALNGEQGIIVVAGDSGNGKSRMSSEVLERWSKKPFVDYVKLDAASPDRLLATMQSWLDNYESTEFVKVKNSFIGALRKCSPTTVLLLDNTADWVLIEDFVTEAPRSVITAEQDLVPADYPHQLINVGPLHLAATQQLVEWFRPGTAENDCARLHHDLAGKPRLLIDCLGMFTADEMPIDELCEHVESDPYDIVTDVGKSSRSVDKAYSYFYTRLQENRPREALFLAALAHLDQPAISLTILQKVHARACELAGIKAPTSAKLYVLNLKKRYLCDLVDGEVHSHQLTRNFFRSLTTGFQRSVSTALFASYWKDRQLFDTLLARETLDWIPAIVRTICRLDLTELREAADEQLLLRVVTDARIGCAQLGDSTSARVMLDRFLFSSQDGSEQRIDSGLAFQSLTDRYENGEIDRALYASLSNQLTDRLGREENGWSNAAQISWVAAEAKYKYASISDSTSEFIASKRKGKSVASLHAAMYYHALAVEQLGYTASSVHLYEKFAHDDSFLVPLTARLTVAAEACGAASMVSNQDACIRFFELVENLYKRITEATPSHMADASYLLGAAWHTRLKEAYEQATPTQSLDLFMRSGLKFAQAGYRRKAVKVHAEMVSLRTWAIVNGYEGVPEWDRSLEASMYDLSQNLGEVCTVNRLDLSALLLEGFLHGFTDAHVHKALSIAFDTAYLCENARVYKQAMLAAIVMSYRMRKPSRPSWLAGLFEVIQRTFPQLELGYFNYWLKTLVTQRPADVLLL